MKPDNYKVINPIVVFFAGWLVWWTIFSLSPFQTDVEEYMRHPAFGFWKNCLKSFLGGMVLALFLVGKSKKFKPTSIDFSSLTKPLFLILVFCFIIDALQTVDFMIKAGGANDLASARTEFRGSDSIYPKTIALGIWLFFKASIFPIFVVLLMISKKHTPSTIMFYLSLLLAFYALSNVLIFGKRAFMVVTLGIYFSYFVYFKLWQIKGLIFKGVLLVVLLFSLSYVTFNARYGGTSSADYAALRSIQDQRSYAKLVLPTPEVIESIETDISNRNKFLASSKIAGINFAQYYTHGTFEFFDVYDFSQGKEHPNGMITLSMPYKVLSFLGITKYDLPHFAYSLDPRPWIFDSFIGGQYKDWGEKAVYSMFIIGFIFSLVYRAAQSSPFLLPLYAVFSNIVFFMPVTDLIYNSQAWHYITLSLLFYFYMNAKTKTTAHNSLPAVRRGQA